MIYFSTKSEAKLETAHFDLQNVMNQSLAVNLIDFTIVEGFRPRSKQDEYFNAGKSKVRWPDSKHNAQPSLAIDAVPYVNHKLSYNKLHCCFLAGIILTTAKRLSVDIRWGGNWDLDLEPITDQDFQDLVHYELIIRNSIRKLM